LAISICIYFLPIAAGSLQLPIEAQRQILRILFLNALVCIYVSWVVEPVAQVDRKFVIVSLAWTSLPVVLGYELLLSNYFLTMGLSIEEHLVFWGTYAGIMWALISSPFARAWVYKRARYPELISLAEQRLRRGGHFNHPNKAEIRLSPQLYYGFLAGIFAVVVVISETVISELLENKLGTAGYVGASIIALGLSVTVYPIHKRVSKYVSSASLDQEYAGANDAKSAMKEIGRALRHINSDPLKGRWYVAIPLMIGLWLTLKYGPSLIF
jgi:hypothetical protein